MIYKHIDICGNCLHEKTAHQPKCVICEKFGVVGISNAYCKEYREFPTYIEC